MIGGHEGLFKQEGIFERVYQDLFKNLNQEYQDPYLKNIN